MKTIGISFRLLAALLVAVSGVRGDDNAPPAEPDHVGSLVLPLMMETGDVSIHGVPVRLGPGGVAALGDGMCAPVFVTSARESDRTRDINLISASGIKISLKRLAAETDLEIDMTIDLSHFKKPEKIRMKEPDIVQAILVCMRAESPAGYRGKVNVKIVGAADPSEYSKMEGPLWSSGYIGDKDAGKFPVDDGDFRFLGSLYMPLVEEDGVDICSIPVKHPFEVAHAFITPFCAPVHPASAKEAERKVDINLTSLAKIGVTLDYIKPDGWMTVGAESNLTIDLTRFTQPRGVNLELYDIVQTILTCLRMNIPATSDGKINVRIVGARDPSEFAALEEPLWRSGYRKPEEK